MIPLILHTERNFFSKRFKSMLPLYHDFTWVSDLGALMGDADMSLASPEALQALSTRLSSALEKVVGEEVRNRAQIIPLIASAHGAPGRLRGVMVALPKMGIIQDVHMKEFAQHVAREWKAILGHECAVLSELGEFSHETASLAKWFNSLPARGAGAGLDAHPPLDIPGAVAAPLVALVNGEPLAAWAALQEEAAHGKAPGPRV